MTEDSRSTISLSVSQIVLILLLFSSFIFAFFPVFKDLINVWSNSDDYSHGFLIIPFGAYITWRKRNVLTTALVKSTPLGLAGLIFSLVLYIVGHFGEIYTVKSLSLVLTLASTVLYLLGYKIFKELLFPIFILLLMIPVPAQIYAIVTIPLQLLVSKISVAVASSMGIHIYREGNIIHLFGCSLEVVQACSGLRYMISLLTLSAVFAYFTLKSNYLRTILSLFGILAALIVNILRVLIIIVALSWLNYDLTAGQTHFLFGVIIFILALILIASAKGILSIWDRSIDVK